MKCIIKTIKEMEDEYGSLDNMEWYFTEKMEKQLGPERIAEVEHAEGKIYTIYEGNYINQQNIKGFIEI